ncbi:MAG: NAD(P)-dependent oxidoreductase [Fervidobacterium sp.]|nr:NAD(P)-dependent oxidoreductase [Fervidobacterium sp.]
MIAIIGSDGFIGNYVKKWAEKLNIEHKGIYFSNNLKGDISFEEYLNSEEKKITTTLIITAGNSDHNLPRTDFLSTLEKDLRYLERLEKSKVSADVVFLSSAAVYYGCKGDVDENTAVQPLDYYGLSKLYAEHMVNFMCRKANTRLIIFRLTNAFGVNDKRKRLFDNILECLKEQRTFSLYGKGESYVNPLRVDKVSEIILKSALKINELVKENNTEIVNLCSLSPYKVVDIVKYISKKYGLKFRFTGQEDYIVEFNTTTKKLQKLLDILSVKISPLYDQIDELLEKALKGENI